MIRVTVGMLTGNRRVECQECRTADAVKFVVNLYLCADCARDLAREILFGLPEPIVVSSPIQVEATV